MFCEEEVQVLRELVRLRHHLQKDKKNYLRKAYTLLNLVFPEYTNLIRSPFKKVSSMILKKYPTAVDMARRIQGNNYSSELAEKLIQVAKESIYSGKASEVRGMALRILIDEIESLQNKIEEIEDKIEEILSFNEPSSPQKRLLSIPGVGPKTVAAHPEEK